VTVTVQRARDTRELAVIARRVRLRAIEMVARAASGYPGGSLSAAEMLIAAGESHRTAEHEGCLLLSVEAVG